MAHPVPARPDAPRAGRPAWLPLVAMLAVVAVCVTAGNWQRGRMLDKEALRAALDAADRAGSVTLPRASDDWSAWRYRRVTAQGRFDAGGQFLVDNRVHNGRVGYDVVTPLALPDGARLLVDRGFVPAGADRAVLPDAPPPAGEVSVEGRLEMAPRGYRFGNPEPSGVVWPHLDVERYAARSGHRTLPVYLQSARGDDALARDWPPPDLGTEKHLGYMVQWYTFAALAAGLYVYFTARRLRRRR